MSLIPVFKKQYYRLPNDNVVEDVLIPAMKTSTEVLIKTAYFNTNGLATIAPGLTEIIQNENSKLKILISLLGITDEETLNSIENTSQLSQEDIEKKFRILLNACENNALQKHAKDCLSYLLATEKAEIRLVGMASEDGMWHPKKWIFNDTENVLVVTGSANFTNKGLTANGEELYVFLNHDHEDHIKHFNATWHDEDPDTTTHIPSAELIKAIKSQAPATPPTKDIATKLFSDLLETSRIRQKHLTIKTLVIPEGLNIDTGKYEHQGMAIQKLEQNNYSGMLSIATGGGKTKTSLVAATRIQNAQKSKNTAILILAPTTTLTNMWEKEVREFSCEAHLLNKMGSKRDRTRKLQQLKLVLNQSSDIQTLVLIGTRQLFSSDPNISEFFQSLSPETTQTLIIGDEAHTLGSAGFQNVNPDYFEYRIGLSATPERAFDEEGSSYLTEFFKGEVFNFEIKDAIQSQCLTPYKYYIHYCPQSEEEFEEFESIQDKIDRLQGMQSDDDPETKETLTSLYFKRTALISQTASKIGVLKDLLDDLSPIDKALFFASSGARNTNLNPDDEKQITMINRVLSNRSIHFHQITNSESSSKQTEDIQDKFKSGDYQAITAMKMLDEGVDLPMAKIAFLVGSNKSEREWIQRRGRVLRNSPGKDFAIIHDFVTLPCGSSDRNSKWIARSEIKRITAFVDDSMNLHEEGQGWDAIDQYRERIKNNG